MEYSLWLHISDIYVKKLNLIWEELSQILISDKNSTPQRTGRHFAEDIIKFIFSKQIFRVLLKMTLKFLPMRSIDDMSALVGCNDLNQN